MSFVFDLAFGICLGNVLTILICGIIGLGLGVLTD